MLITRIHRGLHVHIRAYSSGDNILAIWLNFSRKKSYSVTNQSVKAILSVKKRYCNLILFEFLTLGGRCIATASYCKFVYLENVEA